jgi:hypothetical protein
MCVSYLTNEWRQLAVILFAGLNQLLSYYAKAEKRKCPIENPNLTLIENNDSNACTIWRRFSK